ncbi:MAG TPA: SsrA-binding protein SmpB [Candidatus Micrarchaeia archaeon]|nr:SsrA-binding protein SmpB [Candidatus Micrarchaeia archaeon]
MTRPAPDGVVARNRRAFHDYFVLERVEAGVALTGSEVRSIRQGGSQIAEAYVRIEGGEAWLLGAHIRPYEQASRQNHEPGRRRRLLLHRREIDHLVGIARQPGHTLVPLDLHLARNRVKCEVGVCRGKRQTDKRQAIAEREAKRQIDRAMRRHVVGPV